ncbi:MAG: NAD(P)-dependent oxidoreductase [Frankiaceae bacterium]|nr:NAD(P)-dependent oxidoreductase [Frankiaceae bacterium]
MRVLLTGAHGKVGRAASTALLAAGHRVTGVDLAPPVFERDLPGQARYVRADLTDAGAAYAVVRGHDAVVHAAAIPDPLHDVPHEVFGNNLMSTFNVLEAAVRWGVTRLVNISSETVPGFFFPERPLLPAYVPVDEDHPVLPQDPYALAKHFGEQLMDAAVRRSDLRCTTIRPSWVQNADNYSRNLGPMLRDRSELSASLWSYIDAEDLADAIVLAVQTDLPGHEVFYIASPDNVGGRDLAAAVREHYGAAIQVRELSRPDASGISSAKAERLLGYRPTRSWRDHLTERGEPLR